jgi:hypothetical protein
MTVGRRGAGDDGPGGGSSERASERWAPPVKRQLVFGLSPSFRDRREAQQSCPTRRPTSLSRYVSELRGRRGWMDENGADLRTLAPRSPFGSMIRPSIVPRAEGLHGQERRPKAQGASSPDCSASAILELTPSRLAGSQYLECVPLPALLSSCAPPRLTSPCSLICPPQPNHLAHTDKPCGHPRPLREPRPPAARAQRHHRLQGAPRGPQHDAVRAASSAGRHRPNPQR